MELRRPAFPQGTVASHPSVPAPDDVSFRSRGIPIAFPAQGTAPNAVDHKLSHKEIIRRDERRAETRELMLQRGVHPGQLIPGDAGIEMVLQVIILVAHEKLHERAG